MKEHEWRQMVNQDPHSWSVAGDSGHEMMTTSKGDEPINSTEGPVGAVSGINQSVAGAHLSNVKWRGDNPLFVFDDKNITKLQTPAATSTPVQTFKWD